MLTEGEPASFQDQVRQRSAEPFKPSNWDKCRWKSFPWVWAVPLSCLNCEPLNISDIRKGLIPCGVVRRELLDQAFLLFFPFNSPVSVIYQKLQ